MTAYEPTIALEICEKVAEGETLKKICSDKSRFPARQTFHRWVVNNPDLARAYAAARELSSYALEEEALDGARVIKNETISSVAVSAYNAYMQQLRWSAARRNPRVFSERGSVQITVPIQINTSLPMGEDASIGTEEHPNVYMIEAKVDNPVEERGEGVESAELMQQGDKPFIPEGKVGRPKGKRKRPPRKRKQFRSTEVINADTKV